MLLIAIVICATTIAALYIYKQTTTANSEVISVDYHPSEPSVSRGSTTTTDEPQVLAEERLSETPTALNATPSDIQQAKQVQEQVKGASKTANVVAASEKPQPAEQIDSNQTLKSQSSRGETNDSRGLADKEKKRHKQRHKRDKGKKRSKKAGGHRKDRVSALLTSSAQNYAS